MTIFRMEPLTRHTDDWDTNFKDGGWIEAVSEEDARYRFAASGATVEERNDDGTTLKPLSPWLDPKLTACVSTEEDVGLKEGDILLPDGVVVH